jgi:Homeodomain-like domain
MALCVTCGNELHPERAEKYDYCTRRECREQNAKPLTVVTVGVNKAADQYLILNDRTKGDLAAGKYQDQRKSASVTGQRSGPKRIPAARPAAKPVRRAGVPPQPRPRPSWTRSQQDLAVIYNARGMSPEEIAKQLGLSRSTVTQMILAAKSPAKP